MIDKTLFTRNLATASDYPWIYTFQCVMVSPHWQGGIKTFCGFCVVDHGWRDDGRSLNFFFANKFVRHGVGDRSPNPNALICLQMTSVAIGLSDHGIIPGDQFCADRRPAANRRLAMTGAINASINPTATHKMTRP